MTVLIMAALLSLFAGLPQIAAAEPVWYDVPLNETEQLFVIEQAERYHLSPALCLAVMAVESDYNVQAQWGASSGIMQLNENTYPQLAEDLEITNFDVYNFQDNVSVGIYKLSLERDYWQEQGLCDEDVFAAMLISYNRGRAGARQYIKQYGLEAEYVQKVMAEKETLEIGAKDEEYRKGESDGVSVAI